MNLGLLRVLLIEDDALQRQVLSRQLKVLGLGEVLEACDGMHALTLIEEIQHQNKKIDIVISDIDMPRMDGIGVIRFMAEGLIDASLVLISAISPSLLRHVEQLAMDQGVQLLGALTKPIDTNGLHELLIRKAEVLTHPDHVLRRATLHETLAGLASAQFEPYFLPILKLSDRSLLGAEVLARWHHPRLGLLSPEAFLPLIERYGLASELTEIMLRRSAEQLAELGEAGNQLTLSVNLSLSALREVDEIALAAHGLIPPSKPGENKIRHIADRYSHCILSAGIAPDQFTLEVREQDASADLIRLLETLTRLRLRGFRLSVDNFGSGKSSLEQLLRLPLSEVKLDRGLVTGARADSPLWGMLQKTMQLANRMDLFTVAEGVESMGDWRNMSVLGCDAAQGFLVAQPLPADVFKTYVLQNRALLTHAMLAIHAAANSDPPTHLDHDSGNKPSNTRSDSSFN